MTRVSIALLLVLSWLPREVSAQDENQFHWSGTGLTLPRLPEHIYGDIDSPVDVLSSIALLPIRNSDENILTLIALRQDGTISDPADQVRFARGFLEGYFDGKVDMQQPPVPPDAFGRYSGTWLSFKDQRSQPGLAGTAAFVYFENLVLVVLDSAGDAEHPPQPSGKLQYVLKRLSYKTMPPPLVPFSQKLLSPGGITTLVAAVMMLLSIAYVVIRRARRREFVRQAAKVRIGDSIRPSTGRGRKLGSGPSRTYRR